MIRHTVIRVLAFLVVWAIVTIGPELSAGDKPVWWERAEALASRSGYRLVTPEELKAVYASAHDFVILDVRTAYEYKAGHLPQALHMEFGLSERSQISPEKKKQFTELLGPDKDRCINIYCRNYL